MNKVAENHWKSMSRPDKDSRLDWGTPWDLYNALNEEFQFTVDVCANADNAKHKNYWDEEKDGLKQDWSAHNCFMNPPYGREIGKWLYKAVIEAQYGNALVVAFVYTRTDTAWWHNYAMKAAEIRLIRGRTWAEGADGPSPAPHCILIFRKHHRKYPEFYPADKQGRILEDVDK